MFSNPLFSITTLVDIGESHVIVKKGSKLLWLLASKPLLYLGALWMVMHLILYSRYGVKIVFDSYRYLNYVESIVSGSSYWLQPHSIFYSSYTLFLFLVLHVLSQPIEVVIALQILLSGVATVFFYKTLYNTTQHRVAAFIGVAFYLFWPQIHSWGFYIHTESLYISTSIFTLYLISKTTQNRYSLFVLALILCFAIFLRPNGIFLLLGVIAGVIYLKKDMFTTTHSYLVLVLVVPALLFSANYALEIFSPLQYLSQGQIIQGYNKLTIQIDSPQLVPTDPALLHVIGFIKEQPVSYIKLLLLRFIYLWAQVRPYYSNIHNIAIVIFFIPVFILALRGIRKAIKEQTFIFMVTVLFLQTVMTMVIAVDWDNRFVVPLLPFVFYFASIGFTSLLSFKYDA
ncbi:glycosyltransferase family 39 protein [Pontibacter sp. BAB1700]|uniref:glycosyltransferase family 39 protein n=1 Tax=Pontibacter sp. BAB1700 TaxID=1144253 RepID=UPI00026BD62A|nr:glycosyltransferase family 39 protein [Pontibacter sp. BAB1700]EJF09600.1 hypothetical protein O71_14241 [Pontibacter sp. BAB1700]